MLLQRPRLAFPLPPITTSRKCDVAFTASAFRLAAFLIDKAIFDLLLDDYYGLLR